MVGLLHLILLEDYLLYRWLVLTSAPPPYNKLLNSDSKPTSNDYACEQAIDKKMFVKEIDKRHNQPNNPYDYCQTNCPQDYTKYYFSIGFRHIFALTQKRIEMIIKRLATKCKQNQREI